MRELLEPADSRGRSRALTPAPAVPAVRERDRAAAAAAPPEPPFLLFEQVSKWYGPVIGVNQVTLELRAGVTGLVGANGAGKSTLLRLATGQLRPDLGRVRVLGHDAWDTRARAHVGYCPDTDSFYDEMSGRQFVLAMARLRGYRAAEARRRTDRALERVGMAAWADRRVRGYSKGMRQRVKLAQALVHDPALLIMDEPLSGIDPIGRQEFLSLFAGLAAEGKCLLVSSHELEALEKLTDHVAVMARGRIAAVGTIGRIRELLDDHPMSVRVDCDRPREMAVALFGLPDVVGVGLEGADGLVIRARNPRRFFRDLAGLILEEHFDVRCLEHLDGSAHAVLGYLLGT